MKTNRSALIAFFSALPLVAVLAGCAGGHSNQDTGRRIEVTPEPERTGDPVSDQRIEDGRTAERVREALAAVSEYKFDGVRVSAFNGVVQLNGAVNTSAQRHNAGELTGKVAGVKIVVNNLAVEE